MPKHKKTKKQKAVADVRRQTEQPIKKSVVIETKSHVLEQPIIETTSTPTITHKPTVSRFGISDDYRYVGGDLRKTLVLTSVIIVAEVILKFGLGI